MIIYSCPTVCARCKVIYSEWSENGEKSKVLTYGGVCFNCRKWGDIRNWLT